MPNNDTLLTAAQVAAQFDVHVETVRRWGRTGKLTAVVFPSGRKRYRATDVVEVLEAAAEAAS